MEFKNEDKLRPEIKDAVLSHARQLAEILGNNLLGIAVYGTVLKSDFAPGKSNINLLLILQHVDVPAMKSCLKLVVSGQGKKIVAPLMLTPEHIASSLDVFPLEFLELSDNHLTIYGDEFLADLQVNKKDLRLQCERELKGKLIHLRQGYLESSLRGNSLKMLLEASIEAFLPILRASLYLWAKQVPPTEGSEVINALCGAFPLDCELFLRILNLKRDKKSPPQDELETMFAGYLIQIQKLVQLVDQMEVADFV